MRIGDGKEEQILYYIERPKGRFIDGDKIPTFDIIAIEMPTRIMSETKSWIESDEPSDLYFELKIRGEDPIENFTLIGASIVDKLIKKSRVMDLYVTTMNVKYSGVKNAFL